MTDVDVVADRPSASDASAEHDGGVDRLLAQDLLDALQRADWWPAYSDRLAELLALAE
ncbi:MULTISPECIES: hypothetical protein [Burkholderia]|uniref:hypothetical protein n=1 Tax=Burkholderia TaxID=32008 RepID=UPI001CF7A6F5|nr:MULTISPECIES: hypothetical protein [Burkholderia]